MSRSTKKNVRLTRATVPHSMNGIQNPLCLCDGLVCVLAFQLFNYRRFTCSIDSMPVHPSVRLFHTQRIRCAALRSSGNQPVLISRLCARHLYTNSKRAHSLQLFPAALNRREQVEYCWNEKARWVECGLRSVEIKNFLLHSPRSTDFWEFVVLLFNIPRRCIPFSIFILLNALSSHTLGAGSLGNKKVWLNRLTTSSQAFWPADSHNLNFKKTDGAVLGNHGCNTPGLINRFESAGLSAGKVRFGSLLLV